MVVSNYFKGYLGEMIVDLGAKMVNCAPGSKIISTLGICTKNISIVFF